MNTSAANERCKVAIVAEGGGQRGIYTAGVLDAFQKADFNPFDLGIGVSAGAQNLLAFFLQQPGYARRAITELTSRPGFLVPYRGLTSRSIMDLDGYFETSVSDPEYRLPYQDFASVVRQQQIQFVAPDRETLNAIYLEPDETNVLACVKASSAVPFLYKSGVRVGQQWLMDGGVADPLPVLQAYKLGARHIVLVRTVPVLASDELETPWRRWLEHTRPLPIKTTQLLRMLECHEQALKAALDFMRHPPDDVKLHVIAPLLPLQSQVLASRSEHLQADYLQGLMHGQRAIDELATWLLDDQMA